MLQVGDSIPSFSCVDQDGNSVTDKDFAGKTVVLYFYPKDNTPGCTKEACDFTDQLSVFKDMGVKIYGMSKDSPEMHRKFIASKKLEIDLLSDEEGKILEQFGVLAEKSMFGKKYVGISRVTLIIGPDKKIAYVFPKVKVLGHVKKVIEVIKKLGK